MKKVAAAILMFTFVWALTACEGSQNPEKQQEPPASQAASDQRADQMPQDTAEAEEKVETTEDSTEEKGKSSILVAYFSWAENAILEGEVDAVASPSVLVPGNVQQLAGWVQEETGADLFSIRVTEPYPSDWDACLERANQERGDNARPALQERVENLDQYDTVFLGYPNWWYGVPMALLSFLEENDLSGKQVYLFCSHGTGGLASSVEIITEAVPEAMISDAIFDCYEEEASSSEEAIKNWVAELGYTQQRNSDGENHAAGAQISVRWGENSVVYALNDSPAAHSLLDQLPLTMEVEDYSTNEKIFYPPRSLETRDTPAAEGSAGTLAYYEPWGDVVMFYGDYNTNPALYELGQIVSGDELVSRMSGSLTIDRME